MKGKTLCSIIIGGAMALTEMGCNDSINNKPNLSPNVQNQQQNEKRIFGKIVGIDEDSFAIYGTYSGSNFEFEHFRIEEFDGSIKKLIFPGPSNYQIGDSVNFLYVPKVGVTHEDLFKRTGHEGPQQNGYFNVNGLIIR